MDYKPKYFEFRARDLRWQTQFATYARCHLLTLIKTYREYMHRSIPSRLTGMLSQTG